MFILTISVILIVFLIDIALSTLNYKNRNQSIPENVKDVYNEADYKKWHLYTMEVFKFSIVTKIINTSLLIIFLIAGIFPILAGFVDKFSNNSIIRTLLFLGAYTLISYLLNIGFSIYRTFNIEERYGFNKTTVKTFILDQIKSLILGAIIGGSVAHNRNPEYRERTLHLVELMIKVENGDEYMVVQDLDRKMLFQPKDKIRMVYLANGSVRIDKQM